MRRTPANQRALEGTKGLIIGNVERFDESRHVFARNRALIPGSDPSGYFRTRARFFMKIGRTGANAPKPDPHPNGLNLKRLIPESCMKINEKLGLCLMDENHFISLLFTLRASRRLPSAALLRARNSSLWLRP